MRSDSSLTRRTHATTSDQNVSDSQRWQLLPSRSRSPAFPHRTPEPQQHPNPVHGPGVCAGLPHRGPRALALKPDPTPRSKRPTHPPTPPLSDTQVCLPACPTVARGRWNLEPDPTPRPLNPHTHTPTHPCPTVARTLNPRLWIHTQPPSHLQVWRLAWRCPTVARTSHACPARRRWRRCRRRCAVRTPPGAA